MMILVSIALFANRPQFSLPKIPGVKAPSLKLDPSKIPGFEKFLAPETGLSTSMDDALLGVPILDHCDPKQAYSLLDMPRDTNGEFLRLPGFYEIAAQSFCLMAGTFPPKLDSRKFAGAGYLYAPLKGTQAALFKTLLEAGERHPDVPQGDVQVILWAILSQTKPSDWGPELLKTATKLLDKKTLKNLEGDALGVLPTEIRAKVWEKLPESVRLVLDAKNKMRELISARVADLNAPLMKLDERFDAKQEQVSTLFEKMEKLAMRDGEAPPVPLDQQIPTGRWSFMPDGTLLRLFPNGYQQTRRQVYHPESVSLTQVGDKLLLRVGSKSLTVSKNLCAVGVGQEWEHAWQQTNRSFSIAYPQFGKSANAVQILADLKQIETMRAGVEPESTDFELLMKAELSLFSQYALGPIAVAYGPRVPLRLASASTVRPIGASRRFGGGFGGTGGSGAGMGTPGSQRLGQTNVAAKDVLTRGRAATKALSNMGKIAKVPGMPLAGVNYLMDWQFTAAGQISDALSGGSTEVAMPGNLGRCGEEGFLQESITLPRPRVAKVEGESAALFETRQALVDTLQALNEALLSQLVCLKRFNQARDAKKDEAELFDLGKAVVAMQKHVGERMTEAAVASEQFLQRLQKEEVADISFSDPAWATYTKRITTQGYTAEELDAAKALGFTQNQLDIFLKNARSEAREPVPETSFLTALEELSIALRERGEELQR
jgi:hypothetical protein